MRKTIRHSREGGNPASLKGPYGLKGVWIPAFAATTVLAVLLLGCGGSRSRLKIGETAQGEVVEAEGLAPYNNKDMIATKRASLVDAQRNAIEKAVGVFVSARTLVEKAIAIENNILARTDGYVKKYDVISEGPDGDLYKTKIRALVALKELEADLKEMALIKMPDLKRPRVYVTLSEEIDKEKTDDPVAARALEQSLIEQGFVVVSGARAKEAELNMTGKASAFPFQSSGLGGFVSYRARLSLQVTKPGANAVVSSLTKEASGLGGNEQLAGFKALETVGKMAGSEIGTQVAELWSKSKNLVVYLEGAKSFSDVDQVKKHLSAQPGVSDIVLRSYDEDLAQFELELESVSSQDMLNGLEKSQSLPLKILEAQAQMVRLKIE